MEWISFCFVLNIYKKMIFRANKFRVYQHVKTVCKIYTGLDKEHKTKLISFPCGTECQIRSFEPIIFDGLNVGYYCLVRIAVPRKDKKCIYYWAKVAETCLTEQ